LAPIPVTKFADPRTQQSNKMASIPALVTHVDSELQTDSVLYLDSLSHQSRCADRHERPLGDSEVSYYLPSRTDGVNDMLVMTLWPRPPQCWLTITGYLYRHMRLSFSAPACLITRSRIVSAWAIMRLRHPLMAATVKMHNYEDIRFQSVHNNLATLAHRNLTDYLQV
jgi:hypothetical protein